MSLLDRIAPLGWEDAEGFHEGVCPTDSREFAAMSAIIRAQRNRGTRSRGLIRTDTTPAFLASLPQNALAQSAKRAGAADQGGDISIHDSIGGSL